MTIIENNMHDFQNDLITQNQGSIILIIDLLGLVAQAHIRPGSLVSAHCEMDTQIACCIDRYGKIYNYINI